MNAVRNERRTTKGSLTPRTVWKRVHIVESTSEVETDMG
jgi:hypothetical protein